MTLTDYQLMGTALMAHRGHVAVYGKHNQNPPPTTFRFKVCGLCNSGPSSFQLFCFLVPVWSFADRVQTFAFCPPNPMNWVVPKIRVPFWYPKY